MKELSDLLLVLYYMKKEKGFTIVRIVMPNYLAQNQNMILVQDGRVFGSLRRKKILKQNRIIQQEWSERKFTAVNVKLILVMFSQMDLSQQD